MAGMTLGYIAHAVFRSLQVILALTVCGLYGVDLHKADEEHKYSDGKWVYAEITASLSAVTATLYLIPLVSRIPRLFIWDLVLFIFWIAVFGLFGKMYIGTRADAPGIQRMKNAVWVDLVNALLWLMSAGGMMVYWVKLRNNNRTKLAAAGRATV